VHRVAFVHVPKTAGTTLHNLLLQHYRPDEVCPERFNNLQRFSVQELERFKLFSGHIDLAAAKWIPGEKVIISVVREPRARIISLYNFWRSHRWEHIERYGLDGPRLAKSLHLVEFLERAGASVDNAMARAIVGHADYDGLAEAERVVTLDTRMADVDVFGVTERLEESVGRIFARLDLPIPVRVPHDNDVASLSDHPFIEKVEPEPVTSDAEDAIVRLTKLDRRLYDMVASRFDQAPAT
jgi:hypothetical protein